MKRFISILFVVLTISIFLSSCAQRCNVSTNAFVDSKVIPQGFPVGTSFAIIPVENNNQLFSKEVSHKIEKLLNERGFKVAKASCAQYSLLVDYSISSSTGTTNVPYFIPGQTQTTLGNVYGNYGNFASYNQTTQSSGTTVFIPKTYVFFTRKLSMSVYDTKSLRWNKSSEPIWIGNSISVGQSGDLRLVIDYLLVSAFKHFGESTGKYVDNSLVENNKTVQKLRES